MPSPVPSVWRASPSSTRPDCLGRVGQLEARFRGHLASLSRNPAVRVTRVLGGMVALELEPRGAGGYLDDLGPKLRQAFIERGVLLRPLGNVLYFLPPYVIADDEVDHVFAVIEDVLTVL